MNTTKLGYYHKAHVILALSFVFAGQWQCSKSKFENRGSISSSTDNVEVEPQIKQEGIDDDKDKTKPDDNVKLTELVLRYGIKNYESINSSFSLLTGVPANNPAVAAEYEKQKSSLPLSRNAVQFQGSHQVGITKLAVTYCIEAFKNAAAVGATGAKILPPAITEAVLAAPAANLSEQNIVDMSQKFIDTFWGVGIQLLPDTAGGKGELIALAKDLKATGNLTARSIVEASCGAALASLPVLYQ